MSRLEDVLAFWFPQGLDASIERHAEQIRWWFAGGSNAEIRARFVPLHAAAARGECDAWARTARGRLALIVVLDQFSRSIHPDTPLAYAQDAKALSLAFEGLEQGDDARLATVWEKVFLALPLGHSEDLAMQNISVAFHTMLVDEAPEVLRPIYRHSAAQASANRDVIARFGRHPHRNAVLGRASTPQELAYLAENVPVHRQGAARFDAIVARRSSSAGSG